MDPSDDDHVIQRGDQADVHDAIRDAEERPCAVQPATRGTAAHSAGAPASGRE